MPVTSAEISNYMAGQQAMFANTQAYARQLTLDFQAQQYHSAGVQPPEMTNFQPLPPPPMPSQHSLATPPIPSPGSGEMRMAGDRGPMGPMMGTHRWGPLGELSTVQRFLNTPAYDTSRFHQINFMQAGMRGGYTYRHGMAGFEDISMELSREGAAMTAGAAHATLGVIGASIPTASAVMPWMGRQIGGRLGSAVSGVGLAARALDPFSLAIRGGSAGLVATAGAGTLARGAAMLGGGALAAAPLLAAYYGGRAITGAIAGGAERQAATSEILQRQFLFTRGATGRFGQGFGAPERAEIGEFIRDLGYKDWMTSPEELNRILGRVAQMGHMRTVTDVKEFKQRFSDTLDTLKQISRVFSTTMEEAVPMLEEMKRSGFYANEDIARQALNEMVSSRVAGVSANIFRGARAAGAQTAAGYGLTRRAGGRVTTRALSGIYEALQGGRLTGGALTELTGMANVDEAAQETARQIAEVAMKATELPGMQMMIGAFMDEEGNIDDDLLRDFKEGRMTINEIRDRGVAAMANYSNRIKFTRNRKRLSSQLIEKGGVQVLNRFAEGAMELRGMDTQEAQETFLMQMTGMDERLMNIWSQVSTQDDISAVEGRFRRQAAEFARRVKFREQKSYDALKGRIRAWYETAVTRRLDDIGASVQTWWEEVEEGVSDWLLGVSEETARAGADDVEMALRIQRGIDTARDRTRMNIMQRRTQTTADWVQQGGIVRGYEPTVVNLSGGVTPLIAEAARWLRLFTTTSEERVQEATERLNAGQIQALNIMGETTTGKVDTWTAEKLAKVRREFSARTDVERAEGIEETKRIAKLVDMALSEEEDAAVNRARVSAAFIKKLRGGSDQSKLAKSLSTVQEVVRAREDEGDYRGSLRASVKYLQDVVRGTDIAVIGDAPQNVATPQQITIAKRARKNIIPAAQFYRHLSETAGFMGEELRRTKEALTEDPQAEVSDTVTSYLKELGYINSDEEPAEVNRSVITKALAELSQHERFLETTNIREVLSGRADRAALVRGTTNAIIKTARENRDRALETIEESTGLDTGVNKSLIRRMLGGGAPTWALRDLITSEEDEQYDSYLELQGLLGGGDEATRVTDSVLNMLQGMDSMERRELLGQVESSLQEGYLVAQKTVAAETVRAEKKGLPALARLKANDAELGNLSEAERRDIERYKEDITRAAEYSDKYDADTLQGEVADIAERRKNIIEKYRESINSAGAANTMNEALAEINKEITTLVSEAPGLEDVFRRAGIAPEATARGAAIGDVARTWREVAGDRWVTKGGTGGISSLSAAEFMSRVGLKETAGAILEGGRLITDEGRLRESLDTTSLSDAAKQQVVKMLTRETPGEITQQEAKDLANIVAREGGEKRAETQQETLQGINESLKRLNTTMAGVDEAVDGMKMFLENNQ